MRTNPIDLTWLCFVIPIGIIVIVAILGTRSKLRYARRILEAQARGAFDDMNTPKQKPQFRRLTLMAFIGIIGAMGSLAILILRRFVMTQIPVEAILVILGVFLAIIAVAGLLMQREIDRRL